MRAILGSLRRSKQNSSLGTGVLASTAIRDASLFEKEHSSLERQAIIILASMHVVRNYREADWGPAEVDACQIGLSVMSPATRLVIFQSPEDILTSLHRVSVLSCFLSGLASDRWSGSAFRR